MWCRQCQQEVSAARGVFGPPLCARCRSQLQPVVALSDATSISDCGLALESFDEPRPAPSRPSLDGVDARLRRLERILQTSAIGADNQGLPRLGSLAGNSNSPANDPPFVIHDAAPNRQHWRRTVRQRRAWGITMLLAAGVTAFVAGVALLITANALVHAVAWRWGFALTIAGQGLLITGLAAMASRLWRNSRRMNDQLAGVNRRLGAVQQTLERRNSSPLSCRSLRETLRRHDLFPLASGELSRTAA
jgi:hypothetical protein